jgi:hypothetical protein
VTSAVVADASTSALAQNRNAGSAAELRVGLLDNAYLRFSVAGLKQPVQRAVLRVYATDGALTKVSVRTVTHPWSEGTISYANAPKPAGNAFASVPRLQAGRWAEFDVTSAVQGNGAPSFVLTGSVVAGAVASREAAAHVRPQLVVTPMSPAQELDAYVTEVAGATARRYDAKSTDGAGLDGLDVVELPSGPRRYLGVHHTFEAGQFTGRVVLSDDLLNWSPARRLSPRSSQPTVALLPDGGVLIAYERDAPDADPTVVSRSSLVFERYASVAALLAGDPPTDSVAPSRTLSSFSEGTPSIRSVSLAPDLAHSTIAVDFHYFRDQVVDRQATGVLTNFSSWSAQTAPDIDAAFAPFGVNGNLGDRDDVVLRGVSRSLFEGQLTARDFGAWRIFGFDRATKVAVPLALRTDGGSRAFGNPTATALLGPQGKPALFASAFVFAEGAAGGEAGQAIWYREYVP